MKDKRKYDPTVNKEEADMVRDAYTYCGYEYLDNRRVPRELIPIVSRIREIFKPIRENPRYLISSYGRIFDRKRNHFMTATAKYPGRLDTYYVVTLTGVGTRYVHRLVAEAFLEDFNTPGMEVDHCNGRKSINTVDNLQMVTHSENIQRSWDHGFYDGRTKVELPVEQKEVHSDAEIHRVCQLLVQGYSNPQIVEIMKQEFNLPYYSEGFIRIIKYCNPQYQPKLYEIVKNYQENFPNMTKRKFTDQQIEQICFLLSQHYDIPYIAQMMGIEDNRAFRVTVSQLKNNQIYQNIVAKYPGVDQTKRDGITEAQAELIYILNAKGHNHLEIEQITGIHYEIPGVMMEAVINKIKNGVIFPRIKQKYQQNGGL